MKISKAHQRFANSSYSPRALEHPEEFLGPNWKDVLNFWLFLDTLSPEQLKIVSDRYKELDYYARDAAWYAARDAAGVVWFDGSAARLVAWDVALALAVGDVALAAGVVCWATYELIGSHILLSQNKPLTFLPLILDI